MTTRTSRFYPDVRKAGEFGAAPSQPLTTARRPRAYRRTSRLRSARRRHRRTGATVPSRMAAAIPRMKPRLCFFARGAK